jgi:LuxR family quorum-sensing system transcriptional regulator CciR
MALVAEFSEHARAATSVAELGALLGDTAQRLGFRYHALVQHADLASPPPRFLFLQNYPPDWVDTFARGGLHREDPAQRLAARRAGGFAWADLPRLMSISRTQKRLLERAQRAGLGEGYTVPLHAPGERAASCSFVMAPGNSMEPGVVLAAEILAHLAFGAAHDLRPAPKRDTPHLSRRQEQCVALMAQGKTDWEIGVILGLSEETITQYLKAARARFGVSRRTQLAIAAVCHGLIGLDEVISWQ